MKQFFPLFRIALEHRFYLDNSAKGLMLDPTPSTLSLLRRYDLRWRAEGNVYRLYYGKEDGRAALLAYMEQPLALRFVLRSENPYFLNITDIPFPKTRLEKFYFHNLYHSVQEQGATSLAKGDSANHQDLLNELTGLQPVSNNNGAPSPTAAAQLPELLSELIEHRPADVQATLLKQDRPLRGEQPVDDPLQEVMDKWPAEAKAAFLEASRQHSALLGAFVGLHPADLGIVDIHFGQKDPNKIPPPPDEGPAVERTYYLRFEARQTHWRYYIVDKKPETDDLLGNSPADFERMRLFDGPQPDGFEKSEPRLLNGPGQTAVPIYFKTPVPLRERSDLKPKLEIFKKNGGNGANGKPLTIQLPTPDWRRITPEIQGPEQQVFSDMYVYL